MKKALHITLLLFFSLASSGQFVYACVEPSQPVSPVCCCESPAIDRHADCDTNAAEQHAAQGGCCSVDYQVSNSDGAPLQAVGGFLQTDPDHQPNVTAAAAPDSPSAVTVAVLPESTRPVALTSGTRTYLYTQRLRL